MGEDENKPKNEGSGFLEKAAGIIPRFGYDIISHIAPGLLIIATLYWKNADKLSDQLAKLSVMKGADILIVPIILFAAWAVGITLEALTNLSAIKTSIQIWMKTKDYQGVNRRLPFGEWFDEDVKGIKQEHLDEMNKRHAETVFFRIMFFCSLSSLICYLSIGWWTGAFLMDKFLFVCFLTEFPLIVIFTATGTWFPSLDMGPRVAAIAAIVFFVAWMLVACDRKNQVAILKSNHKLANIGNV